MNAELQQLFINTYTHRMVKVNNVKQPILMISSLMSLTKCQRHNGLFVWVGSKNKQANKKLIVNDAA